ncbi:MAG: hypothetical protein QNJ35_09990 [Paracoccaceae bacterium]|nr:hypothetical protein [Paracoccaceae bacterium]
MLPRGKSRVRKRRVFLIPGNDGFAPEDFRDLYKREGSRQGDLSGYRVDVKRERFGPGWRARGRLEGAETISRVDVLTWDDLVPKAANAGVWDSYKLMLQTLWLYLSTGTLRRLAWLSRRGAGTAFYPIAMLAAFFALALIGGVIAASLAVLIVIEGGQAALALMEQRAPAWAEVLVSGAVFWSIFLPFVVVQLRWLKARDGQFRVFHRMHDLGFLAASEGAYGVEVEARLYEFRHRIEMALREDVEEVLVIGHSSGAQFAVSVVSDLLRRDVLRPKGPALSLLTLGQTIPLTSFLPRARRLRADLRKVSIAQEITWIDVSAHGDPCSFALTDPVAVSGVAPGGMKQWPLILSAAFSETLSPACRSALKGRYQELHRQYLCAFDSPGEYDFFRITAGPRTLGQRFRGRRSSVNRIDVEVSRFTSVVR